VAELAHPYFVIFGFVVLDAVIPVFPSESLLTTASNLAAQEGRRSRSGD
jgi:membrane protein DedA with SNARE-associated domain